MRTGFRFDPPRLELTAEQEWVLVRAFGPATAVVSRTVDGEGVIEAATSLGLTARIGSRMDRGQVEAEVGEEAAERFSGAYRAAAARSIAVEGLCHQLAAAGIEEDVPTVFLKGAALLIGGYVQHGSRESCDVDVLVPTDAATRYQRVLIERGYAEQPGVPAEHQLLPVHHPSGLIVEVHTLVRGVRIGADGGSATAQELLQRGLCRRIGAAMPGAFVPADEVLVCHVLVHGVAQHGLSPRSYPMSRFIADVADLSASGVDWERFLSGAVTSIARDVTQEEIQAVTSLAARLAAGDDPGGIGREGGNESRLLRHVLAGAVDEAYRDSLKLRHYSDPLPGTWRSRTLLRNAWHALWITSSQVEKLYGTPSSRLGYLGWKLWRPLDLMIRAGRYGMAWARHRGRRDRYDGS